MFAISLWQPWATAVIEYGKDIENRTWEPPSRMVGQRIAIHAGRRVDQGALANARRAGYPLPDPLPAGMVLGTVRLVEVHHARTCRARCSDWAESDAHHWRLADPRPAPEPVPCRGFQRLWRLPSHVAVLAI